MHILYIYLEIGTGYACAWHKSANVLFSIHFMENVEASVENAGALKPTGSIFFYHCWNKNWN